jgi:hypothetical protein
MGRKSTCERSSQQASGFVRTMGYMGVNDEEHIVDPFSFCISVRVVTRCKDVNEASMYICTPLGQLLGQRNRTYAEIDRYSHCQKAASERAMVSIGSSCSPNIALLLFSFGPLHLHCAALRIQYEGTI